MARPGGLAGSSTHSGQRHSQQETQRPGLTAAAWNQLRREPNKGNPVSSCPSCASERGPGLHSTPKHLFMPVRRPWNRVSISAASRIDRKRKSRADWRGIQLLHPGLPLVQPNCCCQAPSRICLHLLRSVFRPGLPTYQQFTSLKPFSYCQLLSPQPLLAISLRPGPAPLRNPPPATQPARAPTDSDNASTTGTE